MGQSQAAQVGNFRLMKIDDFFYFKVFHNSFLQFYLMFDDLKP